MIKSHVLYRLSYALTLSIEHIPSVKTPDAARRFRRLGER
jgi:hypothetical protein